MNFEIENGIVYRIYEGENYCSKVFHDYENKLITELEARQDGESVVVEGILYKQKYDSTLIPISNNVTLVIGENPLNVIELVPISEGLIEVKLIFENTTLDNLQTLSFFDGLATTVWRYES